MKLDLGSIQKDATKKIKGISSGFRDPKVWIDTGNYALNFRMTGSFTKGIPLGKVTMFAGESGAGKSYLAGSVIKNAQAQGIHTVIIDSESAMDGKWLSEVGVKYITDTGATENVPEGVGQVIRFGVTMIDDVAKLITLITDDYKAKADGVAEEDQAKLLFVIDSLGALQTPTAVAQFQKGDMKGDFGHKPRQLKALVMNCINLIAMHDIGIIATNHTYGSQDMFNPDDVISGGSGPIFAASLVLAMKKFKSKIDEEGNKTTKVTGIRAKAKIMKTRFSKPFEEVNMNIPYPKGMERYSGLFDTFKDLNVITKPSGNKWVYLDNDGTEHKYFERNLSNNEDGILDLIMSEFDEVENITENMDSEMDEQAMIDETLAFMDDQSANPSLETRMKTKMTETAVRN